MSRHTIKCVDLVCNIANRTRAFLSVKKEIEQHKNTNWPWMKDAEGEVQRWTSKRNKLLTRLRKEFKKVAPEQVKRSRCTCEYTWKKVAWMATAFEDEIDKYFAGEPAGGYPFKEDPIFRGEINQ